MDKKENSQWKNLTIFIIATNSTETSIIKENNHFLCVSQNFLWKFVNGTLNW